MIFTCRRMGAVYLDTREVQRFAGMSVIASIFNIFWHMARENIS